MYQLLHNVMCAHKLPVCVFVVTRGCLQCYSTIKMHLIDISLGDASVIVSMNVDDCHSYEAVIQFWCWRLQEAVMLGVVL
jgi:hypothetical protein